MAYHTHSTNPRAIHISKLWRGAVFSFHQTGGTYYQFQYFNNGKYYYDSMNDYQSYSSSNIDRFVYLRTINKKNIVKDWWLK